MLEIRTSSPVRFRFKDLNAIAQRMRIDLRHAAKKRDNDSIQNVLDLGNDIVVKIKHDGYYTRDDKQINRALRQIKHVIKQAQNLKSSSQNLGKGANNMKNVQISPDVAAMAVPASRIRALNLRLQSGDTEAQKEALALLAAVKRLSAQVDPQADSFQTTGQFVSPVYPKLVASSLENMENRLKAFSTNGQAQ